MQNKALGKHHQEGAGNPLWTIQGSCDVYRGTSEQGDSGRDEEMEKGDGTSDI